MILIKVLILIGFVSVSKSQNVFLPNLPLGEYRTSIDRVYRCESTNNHSFKFDVYTSKKTTSIAELKGNITFLKPFDDNLTLDVNFSSWGLTGGWKPNALVYITKGACSQLKTVLGNVWYSIVKSFNFPPSGRCPFPAGTYVTSGMNLQELEDHNFPKVYFYGKYKAFFKLKNKKNQVLGCGIFELNLLRPWEKPV